MTSNPDSGKHEWGSPLRMHVLPSHGHQIYAGSVCETHDDRVVLNMDEPYFLRSRANVLLVCTEPGVRMATEAVVFDPYAPDGATFLRLGESWPIDTRTSKRHAVRLRSRVRVDSQYDLHGVTINLSLGGLAIELEESPLHDRVEVALGMEEPAKYLPCDVVEAVPTGDSWLARLRFVALNSAQRRFVLEAMERDSGLSTDEAVSPR